MHYVMGDIHNEADKLQSVLKKINITKDDELIVLGDLFDRGGAKDCVALTHIVACREVV